MVLTYLHQLDPEDLPLLKRDRLMIFTGGCNGTYLLASLNVLRIWRFLKMGGTPKSHRIFHEINHPAIGYHHLWKPPYTYYHSCQSNFDPQCRLTPHVNHENYRTVYPTLSWVTIPVKPGCTIHESIT